MYKDRERQRETTRLRVRRYRDKLKGVTEKVDNVTPCVTPIVTPRLVTTENLGRVLADLPKRDWRIPKVVGCRKFGE